MSKKAPMMLSFLLVLASLSVSCSQNPITVTAKPGENFTLGIGMGANIVGENMVIKFDEVVGDARPTGAVQFRITITRDGVANPMILVGQGKEEQAQSTFNSYTLTYSLNPYPIEGKEIPPKDYRLTMIVTK